jgi:4-hydroxybenzoate polyprenyltransferase
VLKKVRLVLEMIRFSHTLFALPFALLAAMLAWCVPNILGQRSSFSWLHLLGILICMVGARSAGMAFNRLVDRRIDAQNPRTENRHLPSGQLSVATVVAFTLASVALFFAGTLFFWPNPLPLILGTPVLGVVFAYSYTKRFTSLAHFWLGMALSLAPVATWLALRGSMVLENPLDLLPAFFLGMAVLFWVAGFDIIYACQDYEFDVSANLKSVPARLGIKNALRLAAISHLVMLLLLVALPWTGHMGGPELPLGWIYYLGLFLIAAMLVYEHLLVSHDDLTRVNIAFFQMNVWISVGLLVLVAVDLAF